MSIDPRYLFHEEDDSIRFRIRDLDPKSREVEAVVVGDRRFGISGLRESFCRRVTEQDETRYSDGDDDDEEDEVDDDSVRRRGDLIQPGIDPGTNCNSAETDAECKNRGSVGWELVVREDEEGKSSIDRHEMEVKMVMFSNPDSNLSSSHHNKQTTRDFASVEKDRVNSVSSWESLKAILSDPVTGALMDDATILPCGHSFGAGGLKEVKRRKACFTCSCPISEGSEKPNLSLRVVVHAFCQEEETEHIHVLKKRKERLDQNKKSFFIPNTVESPKTRGIQFPFSIGDRVLIKGNKRTPPLFVGRKAIIMTHCVNGWYVVKTVDNAESIKLQHCSLAKISDDPLAKVTVAAMAPTWL